MLVLNTTTQSIEILLAGAIATTNPSYVSTYADNDGTTFTEGEKDGALNGTTAVAVVSAPAASARRIIKDIVVYNEDTAAVTLTVRLNNNGTYRNLLKKAMVVGETWKWSEGASGTTFEVSDTAYAASWDGAVNVAPSKNAVYDQMQQKLTGSYASAAEITTGTEPAKAVPPDQLKASSPTVVKLTLSGGQLVFPAAQSASADPNTLDDYEEGAWTPAWVLTSGSVTYNNQNAKYVKIGKQVTISCWLRLATRSLPVNTALGLGGLPFVKEAYEDRPAVMFRCNSCTLTGQVCGWLTASSTEITMTAVNNGAGISLSAADFLSSDVSEIDFTMSYFV